MNGDNFISKGRAQGALGAEMWDNSWQYEYSERLNYIDIGLKYRLFKVGNRYELKTAIGTSFAQSVLNYPEYIFIDRGVIVQQDDVTRKVEVGALLLGIENHIELNDRFGVSLSLNYRTTFNKKHILTREVNFDDGLFSSTAGILNMLNLVLQLGYRF